MANNKYRGVEASQEVDSQALRPETRLMRVRARDFFKTTDGVLVAMFVCPLLALALFFVPFSAEMMMLCLWFFYKSYVDPGNPVPLDRHGKPIKDKAKAEKKYGKIIKYDFPFRVPSHAKVFDGSRPGNALGEGITYLGKEISSKLEIWSGNSDLRTHMLVLGTTGSGKTEFLLGLVYNALVQNSGFIYTDGKGDVALFHNVFRLARYLGREDDLVTINFLTSGRDFLDKQKDRTTNTMNPFALGSSGMLIELIVALMDDSGSGGDMWKGRAISFVAGLTRALCFLRDRGYILLDANKFIEYFELPVVERMVWDRVIVENGTEVQIKDELFEKVLLPLKAFILTLPGYKRECKGNQEQKTLEQHGFITMQLTRLFGDMSFTYGYLFQTSLGEVDMYDVVINRRILVVLLPALERAPDSLKMLGKLIVGAIKQMMAGCLGNRLEGSVREIVLARPTNAPVPFYVVLDEYGYYAVLGFAVAPAQARSLGFSIIFAAQDFSSLQKASKEEADATWENTNVRAIGRITSGRESETFRRVVGVSGETSVLEISRKEHQESGFVDGYRTNRDVTTTRVQRIEYDDLAQQQDGEFTFVIGKKRSNGGGGVRVIRARSFFTQVKEMPADIRVNHFLKIEPPRAGAADQDVVLLDALETALSELLSTGKLKGIFPDDPSAMQAKGQPSVLLKTSAIMRAAVGQHRLSGGEAARVALVCLDKEAEVVASAIVAAATASSKTDDEQLKASVQVLETAKVITIEEADDAEFSAVSLEPAVDLGEISVGQESDATGSTAVVAEQDVNVVPVGVSAAVSVDDEFSISLVGNDDEDESDGDGDTTSTDGEGSSGKSGSSSSSGGMVVTLDMEEPKDDGVSNVTVTDTLASTVLSIMDEFDYSQPVAPEIAVPAAAIGDVSLLTFRALDGGNNDEPSEHSQALEGRLEQAEILLGLGDNALDVKGEAKDVVKALEVATSYLQGPKPEPATMAEVDNSILNLLFAAEERDNDFR